MAEPTVTTVSSVSLTLAFVAFFGPTAGPWAVIIASSVGGAMWPMLGTKTNTRAESLLLMLRCAIVSLTATSLIAGFLERTYSIPVSESLAFVALALSAMGNGWRPIFAALSRHAARLAGGEK